MIRGRRIPHPRAVCPPSPGDQRAATLTEFAFCRAGADPEW